jgi:ketosteroid isomerase-like protein
MPTDLETLDALNRDYIRSVAESDTGWFDKHLAPDFLNSGADGTLATRAAFIDFIGRPSAVPDLTCEDVRIRLLGDVALIHARTIYTKPDGQPGRGRYTDIWARVGGRWLCVSADVTRA